jgi:acrylyl-CoA reductase (NADPH)
VVIDDRDEFTVAVTDIDDERSGEVVIDVLFSALNYKDWLVAQPTSRVRRSHSLVGGVEAVGRVRTSDHPHFTPGTMVSTFGGPIGVSSDGGFAGALAVDARYVAAVPPGISAHDAAALGLAGYTAMASAMAIEAHGRTPGDGPTLVTGASGGVGSLTVMVLAQRGHHVVASTGSPDHAAWLRALGASDVCGRDEITDRPERVLGTERWANAVDCVGGATLPAVLRSLQYGGAVAASGLVAGSDLVTSVYPFITRGVSLIGIDAVEAPPDERTRVWNELGAIRLDPRIVESVIGLADVPGALNLFASGATRGRILVDVTR